MRRTFKQELAGDELLVGTLLTTGSPEVAEAISRCGFGWVFIDGEHGGLEGSGVQNVLRAIGERCYALVRVPEASAAWFKKGVDSGCDGIIVPFVNTAEEARRAVKYAKYPPVGERSVGIGRAHQYGMAFKEYVAGANEAVALIIQIEHVEGVRNLDAILDVAGGAGIDGVLIGPYDLSASMGLMGQVGDARVQEAIGTIRAKCMARRVPVGMFVLEPDKAVEEFKKGCRFVAVGMDMVYLWSGAKKAVEAVVEGMTR